MNNDSKGSFWLQSLDQSERRSVFLQLQQQKFNLDHFPKKLIYSLFKLSPPLTHVDNYLSLKEAFPRNDNVGYVRARQIFPEVI